MKLTILFLFILIFVGGCIQNDSLMNVGDIPFDAAKDNTEFEICNDRNIKQYYVRYSSDLAPEYKGEKRGLENIILNAYRYPTTPQEDGYITIRFIVNCKGKTDRFRIEAMDFDYQPKSFDKNISEQLLKITKNLTEWSPRKSRNKTFDFYQYLTFKINDGQIIKIMP